MTTETYLIGGMHCAACSASVQRVVSRLNGVIRCDVNLITEKMQVEYDDNLVTPNDIISAVSNAGFIAESEQKEIPILPKRESVLPLILAAICSALLLYISMGQMFFENLPVFSFVSMRQNPIGFALSQFILSVPVLIIGRHFFLSGIPALFRGHPDMDTLVAIGAGASFLYSLAMTVRIGQNPHAVHHLYYESVAVVITLVMTGKYFETKSRRKTTAAINKLMDLSPDTALLIKDGISVEIPTKNVKIGNILQIKAGCVVPLDGIMLENGVVDESMLTGESMPVEKSIGDEVTGGSISYNSAFTLQVTRIGDDTTLAKIIRFVEEAQNRKAPISKTADRVAGIFVPIVMAIAVISAIVWAFAGKDIAFIMRIFTGVLVIACPCALGLATPTAIMVATGLGAANGILIRNGEALETAGKIAVAVFDKTGTVTVGKPVVTDLISDKPNELLFVAASMEALSEHPLALAVMTEAEKSAVFPAAVSQHKTIAGKGISALLNNETVLLGNRLLMTESSIDISAFEETQNELSSQGKTVVFVAKGQKILGIIGISDTIISTAQSAAKHLHKMGIRVVLLSGDQTAAARFIGEQFGADDVFADVLPEEKATVLQDLRRQYGPVMMVGDGINDAPALAEADIGCALGCGSDIAIESADLILMKNDPEDVARAIRLSRLTLTDIKENLFWAFCYNTVCIPIAAGVLFPACGFLLNPMLAGLAMSLSSICVVTNALRLRLKKLD